MKTMTNNKARERESMLNMDIPVVMFIMLSVTYVYNLWTQGYGGEIYLQAVAASHEFRPFAYRVLVPWTSQILEITTGVEASSWLNVIVVASAVALYFSLKKLLYHMFLGEAENRRAMIAFTATELYLLTLLYFPKVYDFTVALLFTWMIIFLYKRQYANYLLLFILTTLNKETSFLLILFTTGLFLRMVLRWKMISYRLYVITVIQVVLYVGIKLYIMQRYSHLPGEVFQYWLPYNLELYASTPIATFFLIIFLALLIALCILGMRNWDKFFTIAFIAIFPTQLILHMLLGRAWELRVFGESLPILVVLVTRGVARLPEFIEEVRYRWLNT